jgi:hypothetical protein|mmetsp:Transcript_64915/g.107761  ORF Transcript_64915/g.107761 Transcript_64915/m.107761 type:complete len:85 (+) Transcript_64915:358-612(+)
MWLPSVDLYPMASSEVVLCNVQCMYGATPGVAYQHPDTCAARSQAQSAHPFLGDWIVQMLRCSVHVQCLKTLSALPLPVDGGTE